MNIRLLTIAALAAVGAMAAGGSTDLASAAQAMKHNFSKNAPQNQKTYALSTSKVIACRAGRNMIAQHGFSRIHTVECTGATYTYLGQLHGHKYRVTLNAHTGQIARMKRV
jgi:hypothetical protein